MNEIRAGEWVRTCRHRHRGLVLTVYPDCPENDVWKAAQKGLTEEQLAGEWALLFTPDGTVVVPVSDCEPGPAVPHDELPARISVEMFGLTEQERTDTAGALSQLDGVIGMELRVGEDE